MARTDAKKTVSDLESHTGYWLRFVSNHVSHAFKQKIEARGVTVAEWVVMRALLGTEEDGSVNPSRLAESIGLTRGAVSKLVDRLAVKGFVKCRAVKADRRFQTVELTASGRALVPVLAVLADENDREFFGHLRSGEREKLTALLKAVAERHGFKGAAVE